MPIRRTSLLALVLAACGSTQTIDEEMPCDLHDGSILAVPDFLPEPPPRECAQIPRAPEPGGIPFPLDPTATDADLQRECAQLSEECQTHCVALLRAEVALRLYRRVARGAYRLQGNFGQEQCSRLVSNAADQVRGAAAREIWNCLADPIPDRIDVELTVRTDPLGTRRIEGVTVRGAFSMSHPVLELGFVEEDVGCGRREAAWRLHDHPPGDGGECVESRNQICEAICSDGGCLYVPRRVPHERNEQAHERTEQASAPAR